jgi:polyhydroxybutyrate depolymerase
MKSHLSWFVAVALFCSTGCGGNALRSVASTDAGVLAAADARSVDPLSEAAAPGAADGGSEEGGAISPSRIPHPDAGTNGADAGQQATGPVVIMPPSPCTGKATQAAGDSTWTIQTSTSGTRTALVHIPTGYDPTKPTPIVLNFHGLAGSPSQEEGLTLMDAEADSQGFVVVYPQGTGALPSWNAGACCGTAVSDNVDDVGFTSDLLDALEDKLCADETRVFVTGMSNGGFFSHVLGCDMADRIAAIAPVAGVLGIPTCNPSRPVPVIEFHGTSDPLVPYDGDPAIGYPSVADTVAGWVQRDGCTGSPTTTYSNGDATCVTYAQCSQGADVTLCTITGGGHTWPGGTPFPLLGATSTDISATDAMWTFFQSHPLPM